MSVLPCVWTTNYSGTIFDTMTSVGKIIENMRRNPNGIPFQDLCKVCERYFGTPRRNGTSHRVYHTPWKGTPYVNIQPTHDGMSKPYQVKQVLDALEKKGALQ